MPLAHSDTQFTLPLEVEAVLWADAYRERLRPALKARLSADELVALDLAVEQIEQGAFRPTRKLALSA